MKAITTFLKILLVTSVASVLSGCDDPQVYGSVGISSGYSNYGGYNRGRYGGTGVRTNISVGGRIY